MHQRQQEEYLSMTHLLFPEEPLNDDPIPLDDLPPLTAMPPALPAPQPLEYSLTQDIRSEDPQRCLMDFVEWWCFKIVAAQTLTDIQAAEKEMTKSIDNLFEDYPQPQFGRLANRIQIARLSLEALGGNWNMVREELILLKSKLLRQDANADLGTSQQEATPCLAREQHALFQKEYRRVARLVRVQFYLNEFRQRLQDPSAVRKAIEDYEKQINQLFGHAGDDDDSIVSANVRELPRELAGFLLKDLYQTSKPHSLAQRLLQDVQSVLQGKGEFSQASAQSALRHLLLQWHDLVLEAPTLVQLGYGGVGGHKAEAEEDAQLRRMSIQGGPAENVSDIGEDDEEEQDRKRKSSDKERANKKRRFVPVVETSDEEDMHTKFRDSSSSESERRYRPLAVRRTTKR